MARLKVPILAVVAIIFLHMYSFHMTLSNPVKSIRRPWNSIRYDDILTKKGVCEDLLPNCAVLSLSMNDNKLAKYCEHWKEDPSVSQCRKTCGWCKAPAPSKCEDLRVDCDWIRKTAGANLNNYCQKHKEDPTVLQCPKTCGFCKAPAPSKCEDLRVDCDWIRKTAGANLNNYCQKHKEDPTVLQCPKTCGFCTKLPAPPQPPKPHTKPPPTTEEAGEKPGIKTTKTPSGVPSGGTSGFEKECLVAHNKFRALHGMPPLKWNAGLARDAQQWANVLALENRFEHYPGLKELGEGENLAWFAPPNRKCDGPLDVDCVHCGEVVKDWYDEIADYNFAAGAGREPGSVVLHFTQVVWKGTTEMGMATAVANNRFVSVARYKLPGNQGSPEEFKENVPPLLP